MPPIISRNHALNNFRETTVLQDFRLKEKVVVITGMCQSRLEGVS